jgi:hypothetical protein
VRLPLLVLLALGSGLSAAPAATPELKITTRFSAGRMPPSTTTQYIKGDRSRVERELLGHTRVTINQCDQHRVLQLDPEARHYTSYQLNDQGLPAGSPPSAQTLPQPVPSGGTLVVNVETTDTGERKKIFGYTARHVITRQTMVPGPGAVTQAQEIERDGWYIDLDARGGCGPRANGALTMVGVLYGGVAGRSIKTDKVELHRKGEPETGFAVSLTTTNTSHGRDGKAYFNETQNEVVALSTGPLDPALFELPEGFQKADRLQDYVAAGPSPPQGPWDAIKRYWTELFR